MKVGNLSCSRYPSSSPSYSPFTNYFVIASMFRPAVLNRLCYTEVARDSIEWGQSKSGGPGANFKTFDA